MKKIFNIFVVIVVAFLINGCKNDEKVVDKKALIITSIYPLKLIVENIVGDEFRVVNVLQGNVDPHSYELKPSDAKLLADAKLIVRVGSGFDDWVINGNKKGQSIKLASFLKSQTYNNDLHFWLSPKAVLSITDSLCNAIIDLDSKNKKKYLANTKKFKIYLDSIHNANAKILADINNKAFLVEHNSFEWFSKEFNLNCVGSIEEGINGVTGPMYIANLIDIIKDKNIRVIFTEPQINSKQASMLANSTGIKLGTLDPLGVDTNIIKDYANLIGQNSKLLNIFLK